MGIGLAASWATFLKNELEFLLMEDVMWCRGFAGMIQSGC
jgi:hypothetical protein